MIRFAISCLGCKVNTYEAESVRNALVEKGYSEVDFKDEADVYCIFTCAVTNVASSKSRKKIHQAARQNKEAIICVIGCYVQVSLDEIMKDEHIDILVGSSNKMKVPEYIERCLKDKKRIISVENLADVEFEPLKVDGFFKHTRAYLKIQDGCNQYCSYCIIPYARGKERSLDFNEAVHQAKLLSMNHQEIVLTGIHTGRYESGEKVLTDLIREILKETTISRLRISSIEMNEVTDELIHLIKTENRVAKHLHIPLQSGCDATLKRMNRPYTLEQFKQLIKKIRKEVKNISISTDCIVGFPMESEEEYKQTKDFIQEIEFSFIHVFPFSSKDNTVAASLKGHVSNDVKKKRVNDLLALSKLSLKRFSEKFINEPMQILVEKCENNQSMGYNSEYIFVNTNIQAQVGQIINVVGYEIQDDSLVAKEDE